jgi:hypothetical protein
MIDRSIEVGEASSNKVCVSDDCLGHLLGLSSLSNENRCILVIK